MFCNHNRRGNVALHSQTLKHYFDSMEAYPDESWDPQFNDKYLYQ